MCSAFNDFLSATPKLNSFVFIHGVNLKKPLYAPLDPGKHEIRLVHLQPYLTGLRKVKCNLVLDEHPSYEALSYEWGNAELPKTSIEISQAQTPVGQNLFWALYYLRHCTKPRVV
ncbi:hypothetical protein BDZ45DRAFT_674124 [Acephala macrosclerotiorum]|nr:hypothetical protein BDZ45DRAFT_674124 [Acephala macrosclerotiorum]